MKADRQKTKVLQVLFSGLGGHGSVFTSFIEGDETGLHQHQALFYGIEPIKPEYQQFCEHRQIAYRAIQKPAGAELKSVWQAYKALASLKPDVLVLHSMNLLPVCWLYALLHGCRLIPVEHTPNAAKRKSEWFWTYLSFFLARRIVYLTEEYVVQLRRKAGRWFPAAKAVVIPNGVNTVKFNCPGKPTLSGEVVLAMQARFSATKDQATLLQGFALFLQQQPDPGRYKLKLAGDGETLAGIKSLAQELQIANSVEFCGMLAEPELIRFLCTSHLYVHCSLAETMCTAVLQAMACGLTVIGSDISGIRQLIEPGFTGFLVEPRNPEKLASVLAKLLAPEAADALPVTGKRARQFVISAYSHQRMFARYSKLWL